MSAQDSPTDPTAPPSTTTDADPADPEGTETGQTPPAPAFFWPPAVLWLLYLVVDAKHPIEGRWDFLLRLIAAGSLLYSIIQLCRRLGIARLALLLPFVCWAAFEWVVGAYSFWRDLLVALACTAALLRASPAVRRAVNAGLGRDTLTRRSAVRFGLGLLVTIWLVMYVADAAAARFERNRPRSRDWSRYVDRWPAARVGVALSGGGYRAAVFHAGVLQGLEEMSVRPQALSTVSGGSIIGSYYVRGGDLPAFDSLVAGGAFNLKRELLSPWNVVRYLVTARIPGTRKGWLVDRDFTRTDVQARLLDLRLLHGEPLSMRRPAGAPELVVCTTDLISGSMVGFFRAGYLVRPRLPAAFREPFLNAIDVQDSLSGELFPGNFENRIVERPLSFFVSASGAFPGAFEAPAVMERTSDGYIDVRYVLADGGIADNLGIAMLSEMSAQGWMSRAPANASAMEDSAASVLDGLAEMLDSVVGDPRGRGRFSRSIAETDSAARQMQSVMPTWALHFAIASDASALPVSSAPRSTMSELGHAIDAVYRATGGTTGLLRPGQLAIPTLLVSPATLLPVALKEYQVTDLAKGDENLDVLAFPYASRDSLTDFRLSHSRSRRSVPANFQQLAREDLVRWIALLPDDERSAALAKLPFVDSLMLLDAREDSVRSAAAAESRIRDSLSARGTRGEGQVLPMRALLRQLAFLQANTALRIRLHDSDYELYQILRRRLARDLAVFIRASTLDDRFDRETVDALMRLGHVLVILNRPYIEEAMDEATRFDAALRSHGPPTPSAPRDSRPERKGPTRQ